MNSNSRLHERWTNVEMLIRGYTAYEARIDRALRLSNFEYFYYEWKKTPEGVRARGRRHVAEQAWAREQITSKLLGE